MEELKDISKKIMINNPNAIFPKGELSDTYLLSFILSHVDYSILELFTDGNKFAIMNGKTGKITKYGNYYEIKDKNNVLNCSNDYFTKSYDYFNNSLLLNDNSETYLDSEEKKEMNRLLKKYPELDKDDIMQYIDIGYDMYSIDSTYTNELNYEDYEY